MTDDFNLEEAPYKKTDPFADEALAPEPSGALGQMTEDERFAERTSTQESYDDQMRRQAQEASRIADQTANEEYSPEIMKEFEDAAKAKAASEAYSIKKKDVEQFNKEAARQREQAEYEAYKNRNKENEIDKTFKSLWKDHVDNTASLYGATTIFEPDEVRKRAVDATQKKVAQFLGVPEEEVEKSLRKTVPQAYIKIPTPYSEIKDLADRYTKQPLGFRDMPIVGGVTNLINKAENLAWGSAGLYDQDYDYTISRQVMNMSNEEQQAFLYWRDKAEKELDKETGEEPEWIKTLRTGYKNVKRSVGRGIEEGVESAKGIAEMVGYIPKDDEQVSIAEHVYNSGITGEPAQKLIDKMTEMNKKWGNPDNAEDVLLVDKIQEAENNPIKTIFKNPFMNMLEEGSYRLAGMLPVLTASWGTGPVIPMLSQTGSYYKQFKDQGMSSGGATILSLLGGSLVGASMKIAGKLSIPKIGADHILNLFGKMVAANEGMVLSDVAVNHIADIVNDDPSLPKKDVKGTIFKALEDGVVDAVLFMGVHQGLSSTRLVGKKILDAVAGDYDVHKPSAVVNAAKFISNAIDKLPKEKLDAADKKLEIYSKINPDTAEKLSKLPDDPSRKEVNEALGIPKYSVGTTTDAPKDFRTSQAFRSRLVAFVKGVYSYGDEMVSKFFGKKDAQVDTSKKKMSVEEWRQSLKEQNKTSTSVSPESETPTEDMASIYKKEDILPPKEEAHEPSWGKDIQSTDYASKAPQQKAEEPTVAAKFPEAGIGDRQKIDPFVEEGKQSSEIEIAPADGKKDALVDNPSEIHSKEELEAALRRQESEMAGSIQPDKIGGGDLNTVVNGLMDKKAEDLRSDPMAFKKRLQYASFNLGKKVGHVFRTVNGTVRGVLSYESLDALLSSKAKNGGFTFVDGNNLTGVNSKLQHKGGDAFIESIAKKLLDVVGEDGVVARRGKSDEFAIVWNDGVDVSAKKKALEDIGKKPYKAYSRGKDGKAVEVYDGKLGSFSVGHGEDLHSADMAVEAAKTQHYKDMGVERRGVKSIVPEEIVPADKAVPVEAKKPDLEQPKAEAPKEEPAKPEIKPEAPEIKPDTEEPSRVHTLYQGRGKTAEEIYGKDRVDAGFGIPILGKAQYYTFDPETAKIYGDVKQHKVPHFKKALVIDSDRKWRDLVYEAKAGILLPGEAQANATPEAHRKAIEALKSLILSRGYDGVVIKVEGENKQLWRTFGHDTVVDYRYVSKKPEIKSDIPEVKPKEKPVEAPKEEPVETPRRKTAEEIDAEDAKANEEKRMGIEVMAKEFAPIIKAVSDKYQPSFIKEYWKDKDKQRAYDEVKSLPHEQAATRYAELMDEKLDRHAKSHTDKKKVYPKGESPEQREVNEAKASAKAPLDAKKAEAQRAEAKSLAENAYADEGSVARAEEAMSKGAYSALGGKGIFSDKIEDMVSDIKNNLHSEILQGEHPEAVNKDGSFNEPFLNGLAKNKARQALENERSDNEYSGLEDGDVKQKFSLSDDKEKARTLSREIIEKVFPGTKVVQSFDGKNFKVDFGNGKSVDVQMRDSIPLTDKVFDNIEKTLGKKFNTEERKNLAAAGLFFVKRADGTEIGFNYVIQVASRMFDHSAERTLRHEALHLAKELGLFTDAEWKALEKEYRKPGMSDADLEERIADGLADNKSTLWAKIKSIYSKILQAFGLGEMKASEVFLTMSHPSFWARDAADGFPSGQRFSIKPGRANYGDTPEQRALVQKIQDLYQKNRKSKPDEEVVKEVEKRIAEKGKGWKGSVERNINDKFDKGQALTDVDVIEVNRYVKDHINPLSPDKAERERAVEFLNKYNSLKTISGQALRQMHDPKETPKERMVRRALEALGTPPEWLKGYSDDPFTKKPGGHPEAPSEAVPEAEPGKPMPKAKEAPKAEGEAPAEPEEFASVSKKKRSSKGGETTSQPEQASSGTNKPPKEVEALVGQGKKEPKPKDSKEKIWAQMVDGFLKEEEARGNKWTLERLKSASVDEVIDLYNRMSMHFAEGQDKLVELQRNALLSAPLTQIANATSLFYGAYRFTVERLGNVMLSSMVRAFGKSLGTRVETWGKGGAYMGEFPVLAQALAGSIAHAAKNFISSYKHETDFFELETRRGNYVDDLLETQGPKIKGWKGRQTRIPQRVATATDSFLKTIWFNMELHASAYRNARAAGLEDPKEIQAYMAEEIKNPEDLAYQQAYDVAKRTQLQSPKEGGLIAPLGLAVKNALNEFGNKIGDRVALGGTVSPEVAQWFRIKFGSFNLPFVSTPSNSLELALSHTPLIGLITAAFEYKKMIRDNPFALSEVLVRQAIGSAFLIAVLAQNEKDPWITGPTVNDDPSSPSPMRPNSIRVAGLQIPYNRAPEPLSTAMSGIVIMAQKLKKMTGHEVANDPAVNDVFKMLGNKSYTKSIADIFTIFSGGDPAGKKISTYFEKLGLSFVPFSSGVASVWRSGKEDIPDVKPYNDSETARRFPEFFPYGFQPQIDPWGQTVKAPGGSVVSRLLNPWAAANDNLRLGDRIVFIGNQALAAAGEKMVAPSLPDAKISGTGTGDKALLMTPKARMEYLKKAGRISAKLVEDVLYKDFDPEKATGEDAKAVVSAIGLVQKWVMDMEIKKGIGELKDDYYIAKARSILLRRNAKAPVAAIKLKMLVDTLTREGVVLEK